MEANNIVFYFSLIVAVCVTLWAIVMIKAYDKIDKIYLAAITKFEIIQGSVLIKVKSTSYLLWNQVVYHPITDDSYSSELQVSQT